MGVKLLIQVVSEPKRPTFRILVVLWPQENHNKELKELEMQAWDEETQGQVEWFRKECDKKNDTTGWEPTAVLPSMLYLPSQKEYAIILFKQKTIYQ